VFYPRGGGQAGDSGWLAPARREDRGVGHHQGEGAEVLHVPAAGRNRRSRASARAMP
jgi:Ser-tRNA(Ala) deacylase AlaX